MSAEQVVPVPIGVEGDESPTYAACPLCHSALPYVDVLRAQYCEHCEREVDPIELPDQPEEDPERAGIRPAVCVVCLDRIAANPMRYGRVSPLHAICALALKARVAKRAGLPIPSLDDTPVALRALAARELREAV